MLMVIFGAGASYDSSPDFQPQLPKSFVSNFGTPPPVPHSRERWRPPLANQLFLNPYGAFDDIVQRYGKLLPILPRLRQLPAERSLEQQLEVFQNESNAQDNPDRERKRQLFAVRYYLYELFRELSSQWLKDITQVTNYASLIDQIRHHIHDEQIALVTFNYDSLLDNALLSFNYNPQNDLERHFDAHPDLKLFRPHGSVFWSRLTDLPKGTRRQPDQLMDLADTFHLSDKYVVASAIDPHQYFNFDRPIVPAIAIPVQTKTNDTFEWPLSHRMYFEKILPIVTKILLVGWQAKEAHFLEMLHQGLVKGRITDLMVVGANSTDASAILTYFTGQLGYLPRNHSVSKWGFSYFVANEELESFLRA